MTVTFVDAGVLIAAARGNAEASERAISIPDQPGRTFVSSAFIRLKVVPKAVFNKKRDEAEFYSEYFSAVSHWADDHTTRSNARSDRLSSSVSQRWMRCMSLPL